MKVGEQLNYNKRALFGIVAIGLFVLFFLFAAELVIRVIGYVEHVDFRVYMKELTSSDRLPRELFVPHPVFYGAPFAQVLATTSDFSVIYKLNSQGWRDDEHSFRKPLGKKRMLVYGDSFTFGEGIEKGKRFVDIVEQHFSCLEMINTALPGYGLDQILISFLERGSSYEADYAVIFFNQAIFKRDNLGLFSDGELTLRKIDEFNPLKQSGTLYLDRDSKLFKERHWWAGSYFLSFMRYRIALLQLNKKFQQSDTKTWNNIMRTNEPVERKNTWKEKAKNLRTSNIRLLKNSPPRFGVSTLPDDQRNRAVALMEVFHKTCQQRGIKLILVNINGCPLDLSFLVKMFPDIYYFDLSEELMQQSKICPLSFVYDKHYNPLTHQFIAACLIEIFKKFAVCGPVE